MVKAGSSLMRSPLTVVMVCPGGFGSEPGPGCNPGVAADGGAAGGGTTAETVGRGAATWRGPGTAATRLGGVGFTTTSGTEPSPEDAAAGGLASAGAGVGVDWLLSGLGVSVVSGGCVGDS